MNIVKEVKAAGAERLGREELEASLDPSKYVGRAPQQVTAYLNDIVNPMLRENEDVLGWKSEINV